MYVTRKLLVVVLQGGVVPVGKAQQSYQVSRIFRCACIGFDHLHEVCYVAGNNAASLVGLVPRLAVLV